MLCRSVGFTVKRHHCIRGTWAWRHSFKGHGRSWPMRGGFRPCCRSRSIPTNWSKCPRQSTNKGPMRYGFLRSGRRSRPTPHARRRTEGLAQSAAQRKAATSAGAQLACRVGGIVAEPFSNCTRNSCQIYLLLRGLRAGRGPTFRNSGRVRATCWSSIRSSGRWCKIRPSARLIGLLSIAS